MSQTFIEFFSHSSISFNYPSQTREQDKIEEVKKKREEKKHTSSLRHSNSNACIDQSLSPSWNNRLLGSVDIISGGEGGAPGRGATVLVQLLDEQRRQRLRDRGDGGVVGHFGLVFGSGVGLGALGER